jgi:hypothetical protein
LKLDYNNNKRLKAAIKYWKKKSKINNLNQAAIDIQKIWRVIQGRLLENRKIIRNKLSIIFKQYYLNNLISILNETNGK